MKDRTTIWMVGLVVLAVPALGQAAKYRPKVVKVAEFTNQTAAIPQTTIFTPAKDGLYRVSTYVEQVTTNANVETLSQVICPFIIYTDDSGVPSPSPGYGGGPSTSGNVGSLTSLNSSPMSGMGGGAGVFVFRAKANTPILFNTNLRDILPQPWAYSIYVVVELLSH